MTEQEKINTETALKLAVQDAKFAVFINELKEQREDIRRLNERQEADRKALDAKIDGLIKQLHSNFVQTIIGVGAIMAAIGGLIIATVK